MSDKRKKLDAPTTSALSIRNKLLGTVFKKPSYHFRHNNKLLEANIHITRSCC